MKELIKQAILAIYFLLVFILIGLIALIAVIYWNVVKTVFSGVLLVVLALLFIELLGDLIDKFKNK